MVSRRGARRSVNLLYSRGKIDGVNLLKIVTEMLEGFASGGADEAVSEGVEETAEEATGEDL